VTHFAKEIQYDGAKDAEVWLLIAGEGPATSTPASTPPPAHEASLFSWHMRRACVLRGC
jgi:hypothetical protein